jgi:hypothetical protein
MKKICFLILSLIIVCSSFAAEQPRTPFVVLRINGIDYKDGDEIQVRMGEKIQIEAILMGGRRDYCSNPNTYANVGNNTVIESQGENGMSFSINGGQFSGVWSLTEEIATFTSGEEVLITPNGSDPKIKRTASVEFKKGNYSKVFFKVDAKTNWHYNRKTQAGLSEQDEINEGSATFYFVMVSEEGVWYSSKNVIAKGTEDFSVRNNLDQIQKSYNEIERCMLDKNMSGAQMHFNNLKNSISDLEKNLDRAKEKDSKFEYEINLIGLPSDLTMQHMQKLISASEMWKENYNICTDNVQKIADMLADVKDKLSANILRSVFKNYINWGTSIPTGLEDIFTLYDPSNIFGPLDLPRKVMGWYEEAENDSNILKDQVNSVKQLTDLQNFYQNRIDIFIEERKAIIEMIKGLKPYEEFNNSMQNYMQSLTTIKWTKKT